MSQLEPIYTTELDHKLFEEYVMELRTLYEDTGVKLFPSIKDYLVWKQDKNMDEHEVLDD